MTETKKTNENGSIKIHSQNIFPIIKKWLYSERDIFIRELISNSCDAITKLKKLQAMGETNVKDVDYRIDVVIDEINATLSFIDNGIGMTKDEVKKYINQVAFSSAEDFLEKFKSESDGSQIIGHFGLGFYSAFMVSEKVTIDTLSYTEGAEAVNWSCKGDIKYSIKPSDKTDRGTVVTLFMGDEGKEFLSKYKVHEILNKYCSFLPYPIYLSKNGEDPLKDKDGNILDVEPINDISPLWQKQPTECTDEEYRDFYHKVFSDFNDPLFWIHLNVDFPFKLQGILYFPKMTQPMAALEGSIKLYNNQVYVADNIKEVIPEFLLMLKGVVDCPDLPLNVSRSFLQSDNEVQKIPAYITRKVADRLSSMFNTKRDDYENYWKDIHVFVKYGALRDEKFYEKIKDSIIYNQTCGSYVTLKEYLSSAKDRHENIVYYINDIHGQAPYVKMYENEDLKVIVLDSPIDPHFISFIETKNEGLRFSRVDSELPEELKGEGEFDETSVENISKIFKSALGKENLKVKTQALKDEDTAAVAQVNEFLRRNDEMRATGSGMPWLQTQDLSDFIELSINPNSPVIKKIIALEESQHTDEAKELCLQVYDLARLTAGLLKPEDMSEFIKRSNQFISK